MSTTDARTGFRLPWTAEPADPDAPDTGAEAVAEPAATAERAATDGPEGAPAPDQPSAVTDPWGISSTPSRATPRASDATAPARRKPNKLMADLARAMQAAAEAARDETLSKLQADAKSVTEQIHGSSGTEAAELRERADQDIAGIRDWSKAEIARIREETEQRISTRKATLDQEIEAHAARIEQRIERVQARVTAFEQEMAAFFERLLAEEDPTALAAMAENLPEPPDFDGELEADVPFVADGGTGDLIGDTPVEVPAESDAPVSPEEREAAFAAIQAAAEAASDDAETTVAADADPDEQTEEGVDLRLAALGLSPESAEEAEAAAEADAAAEMATAEQDEIPTFDDDAVAARLAGLVPTEDAPAPADHRTTRVVVVGLVSVASIAGFKRQLGRVAGVRSVGVSSGPDGEFVFAVEHEAALGLRDAVAALPGFGTEVTDETEDTVHVTAHDPETGS